MLPVLLFKRDDLGEFICFELLVLWGAGIIKGPLLQRNISTDKSDEPAILAIVSV